MSFEFPICITVDGTTVEGVAIVSSPCTLDVEIKKPYEGLDHRHQLTFFSRLPNKQLFGDNAITHEYAERYLTSLYRGAKHALSDLEYAHKALDTIKNHRRELNKPGDRPRLKELFKSGLLKQNEYQLLVNHLSSTRIKHHTRQRGIESAFVSELFGGETCTAYPNGWERFLKHHTSALSQ